MKFIILTLLVILSVSFGAQSASANVPFCQKNAFNMPASVTAAPLTIQGCPPVNRVHLRDKQRIADLIKIRSAIEAYKFDWNDYPKVLIGNTLDLGTVNANCLGANGFDNQNFCPPQSYLNFIPLDPTNMPYVYTVGPQNLTYSVAIVLEGTIGGLGPGIIHATPAGIGP